jgi:hypothetical protein
MKLIQSNVWRARALGCFFLAAAHASAGAAEPLHPLTNPSLYEQRGVVSNIDTATGAMTIGGKRYKGNARTLIFIADGNGRVRKGLTLADIPPNTPVSFATSADGSVTQIFVGGMIQPPR